MRKRLLSGAALAMTLAGSLVLVGCSGEGSGLSEQWSQGGDKGYVAGDGSTTSFAPADRGEPVAFEGVTEHGEHWVWELNRIPVLGKSFSFTFTERMTFDEPHRIDFTHDPDASPDREQAGVDGWYRLTPRSAGTHLETSMAITVDLPFPGLARPAVTTAGAGTA